MKRALLILIVFAAALIPGRSHAAPVKVTLQAKVEVRASRPVTLREIATISAPKDVAQRIGDIIIGTAPLPDRQRSVDTEYIRRLLNQGKFSTQVLVTGPSSVELVGKCIHWLPEELTKIAQEFLSERLPQDSRTYEVSVSRPPFELVTATGQTVEARPRLLNSAPRMGPNTVALDVLLDGKLVVTTAVTFDVKAVAEVLVAATDIRQGDVLTDLNTIWARRDITRASNPILVPEDRAIGDLVARRTIPLGTLITATDATQAPAVHKGDRICLIVSCGSVRISTTVEAKQDGRIGDTIGVACSASQADVRARVIQPGLVELRP